MTKIAVYNSKGKEVEKLEVSDNVFGISRNDDLIHQVFVSMMANKRQVLAHTKTRGERAGSGIKPWKQKGTGRARVGSVRTPVWRKGGIVFGPRNDRNFSKKINKKMNSKAIVMVLSSKLEDKELIVLDKFELTEKKTKEMAGVLNNLKIDKKVLIAFSKEEEKLRRFSKNIENVSNILADQLNLVDMLQNKFILMTKDSVKMLEEKYKEKVKSEKK